MKKALAVIMALWMCVLLSACSLLPKPKAEITFSVPSKQTFMFGEEVHNYKYVIDETVEREDGFYEVFVTRVDKDSGEKQKIRYIYTADGILIGERSNADTGQQDTIELFDTSFKTYVIDLEDSIDRIKDNRIYLTDGGYQDLELDGDKILRIQTFSEDDTPILDVQCNEEGLAESVTIYDEKGEAYIQFRTAYQTIGLDD